MTIKMPANTMVKLAITPSCLLRIYALLVPKPCAALPREAPLAK